MPWTERHVTLARYGVLLDAVRGLSWPSRRRTTGSLPGSHESRRRGLSPELSEYRAYRQGDDPRQLDWKLLARTDRAYIKLAEERSILSTMFLVDASASMDFPATPRSKWECACAVIIALASIAHASGDPVGVAVPTALGEVRLTPRARRGILSEIERALGTVRPAGSPDLAGGLAHPTNALRIVIVSDFLGDEMALRSAAQALTARGREVHAIHVVAAEEVDPAPLGGMVEDPEQPEIRRALTAESLRGYQRRFAEWREELARSWRMAGASFTEVVTSDDPARGVRRLVAS